MESEGHHQVMFCYVYGSLCCYVVATLIMLWYVLLCLCLLCFVVLLRCFVLLCAKVTTEQHYNITTLQHNNITTKHNITA